ncbi:MAG: recombinase family protein [Deltaproteobacteria bacterium]|nr:recombinase family protein [Deltaproteobacteria bacterium]
MSFSKIAKILNAEGYLTRTGKLWRGNTIRKILKR